MALPELDLTQINWVSLQTLPPLVVPGLVLLASLVGSLHCAGMCGPLVVLAGQNTPSPWRAQTVYHLTRWISYLLLGALSGLLGHTLLASEKVWLTSLTTVMMAGVFLWMAWSVARGGHLHIPLPKLFLNWQTRLWRQSQVRPRAGLIRPAILGLMTPLLPCGWLYTFILGAIASERAAYGALMMSFFWLGTLPALIAVHALATRPLGWLRQRHRWLAATFLFAAGLFTLTNKLLAPCH